MDLPTWWVWRGAQWRPSDWEKGFSLNPNGIAYWQEKPTKKFDAFTNQELDCLASTFFRGELNIFMHYMVLRDTETFLSYFGLYSRYPLQRYSW